MIPEIHYNASASEVPTIYNRGGLIVWNNIRLSYLKDLQSFPVHSVEKWKKLKSRDALAPIGGDMKRHALQVWTMDKWAAEVIQRILRVTENEIRHLVNEWYGWERLGAELHSWRYTLTKNEPLHFDVYADRVDQKVLRVFVNLDTEERIWDVGPIDEIGIDAKYDPVYKARVLKGVNVQRITFEPGTIWAVDSQRVSHAIIYGRRAAMFSYQLKN